MSLAKKKNVFTHQDLLNWKEDNFRHEIIKGEHFMTPSPEYYHQKIALKLSIYLNSYVEKKQLGEIFIAPVDIVFSDIDVLVPDIGFISSAKKHIICEKNIKGAPDIVIEILSHASVKRDRNSKYRKYIKYGVLEYWIVDPAKKNIEVYDLAQQKLLSVFQTNEILNTPIFPDIDLDVHKIF